MEYTSGRCGLSLARVIRSRNCTVVLLLYYMTTGVELHDLPCTLAPVRQCTTMDDTARNGSALAGQQVFSTHYRRLQEIEQKVVHAVEAASIVMEQLSQTSDQVNREHLHAAAEGFVEQIHGAQKLVLESIKAAAPERKFEANNYFPMVQSMVAAEKLDAVSVHVSGISKLLRQFKQQQEQLNGAAAGSGAAEGGVAGDVTAAFVADGPADMLVE